MEIWCKSRDTLHITENRKKNVEIWSNTKGLLNIIDTH